MRFMGHMFFIVFVCGFLNTFVFAANPGDPSTKSSGDGLEVSQIICNVIKFVQDLGLPIMTAVIIGSSIMAIFGRLAWPAIMVLVVFTGIFFGASKVVTAFVAVGTSASSSSIAKEACR